MDQTQAENSIRQNHKMGKQINLLTLVETLGLWIPYFSRAFSKICPESCTDCSFQRHPKHSRDITFMFCTNTNQSVPPMATGQIPYNPIVFSSFLRTDALSPCKISLSETICIPFCRAASFSWAYMYLLKKMFFTSIHGCIPIPSSVIKNYDPSFSIQEVWLIFNNALL